MSAPHARIYYVTPTTTLPRRLRLSQINPPPVKVRARSAEGARAAYLRKVHGLDVTITKLGAPSWRYDSHREVGAHLYTRLRVLAVTAGGRDPKLKQVYPAC